MKIKQKVISYSRSNLSTLQKMTVSVFLMALSIGVKAQCVQNISNSIDCCDFEIKVYDNGTFIGYIGQALPAICSDGCNVPPGTTGAPYTGTIQLNGDGRCGPAQSMATYCTNHPGANISFVIVKLAGSPLSWSVNIPTNGTTVSFSEASCCGIGSHYAKVSGSTLVLWYDCP